MTNRRSNQILDPYQIAFLEDSIRQHCPRINQLNPETIAEVEDPDMDSSYYNALSKLSELGDEREIEIELLYDKLHNTLVKQHNLRLDENQLAELCDDVIANYYSHLHQISNEDQHMVGEFKQHVRDLYQKAREVKAAGIEDIVHETTIFFERQSLRELYRRGFLLDDMYEFADKVGQEFMVTNLRQVTHDTRVIQQMISEYIGVMLLSRYAALDGKTYYKNLQNELNDQLKHVLESALEYDSTKIEAKIATLASYAMSRVNEKCGQIGR